MSLAVGDRLEDERGSRGTVRYVGPVATSKDPAALYYGVEWDDWGRGIHDGSVVVPTTGARVVYFDGPAPRPAADGNPHAPLEFKCSFLKATRAHATMHPRATLLDRLQERYAPTTTSSGPGADVVITGEVGTALGSQKPIELVGVRKLQTQQTLGTIEKISLAHCQIATLGLPAPGALAALTPQITELDLAHNLLGSWDEIFAILDELPRLETLVLSGNRLHYVNDDAAAEQDAGPSTREYAHVRVLVLNQCLLPWAVLTTILRRHFPRLEELHVAGNDLTDADIETVKLRPPPSSSSSSSTSWLTSLEVLDLSANRLRSWATVQFHLGEALVNLKQLVVNGNAISTLVTRLKPAPAERTLQQLVSLSLNDNLIDSWSSIDALNSFPRLATLRFMRNPLTAQMGAGEARMIIVARAAFLEVFNSSPVRAKERRDAEHMYLKRILFELAAAGEALEQRQTILTSHPRYQQLCDQHADIVAMATASLRSGGAGGNGPSTLSSSLVQISIVPMSMNATSFDPLAKKVPQNMKVSQLKMLVERKFGIASQDQLLTFRMDSKSMPMPMDDEGCELHYYGLQDGAEVLVNDAA